MSNVLNRTTKEYLTSVHTPDYPEDKWVINPDLTGVKGIPVKYWKIDKDKVLEMSQAEKDAVDAALLPGVKQTKKDFLRYEAENFVNDQGYSPNKRCGILTIYSDKISEDYESLQVWVDWMRSVEKHLKVKLGEVDSASTINEVESIKLDTAPLVVTDPKIYVDAVITDSTR